MILLIKQQPLRWASEFNVTDENGNDRYIARGRVMSWVRELSVRDMYGREVIFIKQKAFNWTPTYDISICGSYAATVERHITLGERSYTVNGLGLEVRGDFSGHKYSIESGGFQIAFVQKEWFTFFDGDAYTLYFDDPNNEFIALSILLTIDCMSETR